jgi:1-deoxy-D-xylulose-5-phosphate reductoisomerase
MNVAALRQLTILGSTGSIGVSTLDVVARHPHRFRIAALAARNRVDVLFDQCIRFQPEIAVMLEPEAAERLATRIRHAGLACTVRSGASALEEVAALPGVDIVMAAIVGIAGLRPTLAAARAGKTVLLANKESLVTAGAVLMDAVREGGATLLPIDSEHNAIFQVIPRKTAGDIAGVGVRRVLLTASGGPFRMTPLPQLEHVTPAQACAHPTWVMGRKISVDSATMMNKGLEVIEAHWLFGAEADQIEVVIHPESVVHSLVEYVDGSVIAQLGNPDMRTPIAFALGFPERIDAGVEFLDLSRIGALHFERPDLKRFPCLGLAFSALKAGGSAAAVLNAANEVAVETFLEGRLGFSRIPTLIEAVLERMPPTGANSLDDVLAADHESRELARRWLSEPRALARSAGKTRMV